MRTKVILVGAMVVGWLVGLVSQRWVVETTDYMDVFPPLMLLGMVLCLLAGAAVRVFAPGRRMRAGAFGGMGMTVSIIAGYLLLAFAYRDRFKDGETGETWFTLLLESWFWIGVPMVVSAGLGVAGWLLADRLSRSDKGALPLGR